MTIPPLEMVGRGFDKMADAVWVHIRALNHAIVPLQALDTALRRLNGLPPAHYNPLPKFGLRAAWKP